MSGLRLVAILCVLFVLVSSVFVLGVAASDVGDEAVSAVEEAEEAVVDAYAAVLEAEGAGGNVSGLLDRLDVAAGYLAIASMSLRREDLEGAVGNASLCIESLEGLMGDAEALRDRAARASGQRFCMTISGSMVGVVVVVSGSFLGWNWFKKRHYKWALKRKPELVKDET